MISQCTYNVHVNEDLYTCSYISKLIASWKIYRKFGVEIWYFRDRDCVKSTSSCVISSRTMLPIMSAKRGSFYGHVERITVRWTRHTGNGRPRTVQSHGQHLSSFLISSRAILFYLATLRAPLLLHKCTHFRWAVSRFSCGFSFWNTFARTYERKIEICFITYSYADFHSKSNFWEYN